eukprot:144129_1
MGLLSHDEARTAFILAIGALTPFILRSLGDFLISIILRKCCDMTKSEAKQHIIGMGKGELSINNLKGGTTSWENARHIAGLNICAAFTLSFIRLVFWHWMQPLLYWFILYAYWNILDPTQQVLGVVVAVREALYLFLTILGLCLNRTFLLIDLRASWREDKTSVLIYIIAPEKFVLLSIHIDDYCYDSCIGGLIFLLSFMDLCGFGAFVWAFVVKNVYIAMITGYAVTAIGGSLIFVLCCVGACCEWNQKFTIMKRILDANNISWNNNYGSP